MGQIKGTTKKDIAYRLWERDPKVNREQAARSLGVNVRTIHRYIREFEESGRNYNTKGTAAVNPQLTADSLIDEQLKEDLEDVEIQADIKPGKTSSTTVFGKTLDESPSTDDVIKLAIAKAGVNPECWDVGPCKVNFWHTAMKVRVEDKRNKSGYLHKIVRVTNWSVKITLLPNRTPFVLNAIRDLVDTLKPIPKLNPINPARGDYCGVLAPIDVHFGKFAWNNETMTGHMDLDIVKRTFIESCQKNLDDMCRYHLDKIYIIVGQDLMHFESYSAETHRGKHRLDVDGRLPKTIKATKEALIHIVDQAAQIAPVEVLRVPGNHDMHGSYWLVELMRERYRNNDHVTTDNGLHSESPYKLIRWGNLMVGLMHDGSGAKLQRSVNAAPIFWRKDWGECRYSELWVGHKHNKADTKTYPVHTIGGTLVRQLSALCTNDFWHLDNMFVDGVPACESFILDKSEGVVANFKRNIDYLEGVENG